MEEALIKRIMPNSLEAEQSVVGSMIMSKDAIVTASEMLLKEDFIISSTASYLRPWLSFLQRVSL